MTDDDIGLSSPHTSQQALMSDRQSGEQALPMHAVLERLNLQLNTDSKRKRGFLQFHDIGWLHRHNQQKRMNASSFYLL